MPKARIMIVEDEVIIAGEIRMILEKFGYEVTAILDSGEAAIERVKTQPPDLILMDINLKGDLDGIQAGAVIRESHDIPVIYLTASAEEQKLERAKQTTPAGYIVKPFSDQDIRIALEIGFYVSETARRIAENRNRLAAAERLAGFGSCETDIKTGRCVWSDGLFRICGYEPGAFEPDADMNARVIHPGDRERVADLLEQAIETGCEYDLEKRIVRPDGTIRYVHSLGSVMRDGDGRPVRMTRTMQDITVHKRLERQNRLNRLRLEMINEMALLPDAEEKNVCDLVLERMLELSDSRIGYLGFMTEDEQTMLIHSWSPSAMASCEITDRPIAFAIAESGLWGEPVRLRGPVIVNDYDAPHETKKGCPAGHVPITRFLSVPVFDGGRIVALAAVGNRDYAYTSDDTNQLGLLMQAAWEQVRRNRADRAIAASEEKYRSLISNIPDVTWTADAAGNTVFISENIEFVYGYTAMEVCAAGTDLWFGRIHPDDIGRVKQAFEELFEKKANFDIEYRVQKEDGLWIWRHDRAISVYERDGVKYADGIFSDVTERKRAESELRFQSRILGQIQNFVTVTDLEGRIVYVNDVVVRAMKRSREEIIGTSVVSFGEDPSRGASQKDIIEKTLAHGQWRGEVVNYRPDGTEIILDSRTTLIYDKDSNPVNMIGVSSDITERKETEDALRKSEERLRAVFEAAENVVFIITDGGDPDPIIIECSPGAETIFGYSRQEMIGRSVAIFHQPHDFKRIPEARRRMRKGQKGFSGEFTLIRKSGEPFPALLTTYPMLDDKGRMFAALGVAVDISGQKKLEEQLRQSQRMESIGTLAGGIAHDFNNILYPIIGHSEMLIEDLEGQSGLQERVRSIMNSALRAADLVKQILSFSRQSKKGKTPVKMQEIIHEVLLLIRHSIPAYIHIVLKIDNSCRPVLADAGQVHQVIMNLIANANHAMAGMPGTLEIGLSEVRIDPDAVTAPDLTPGRYVDLYVADTGTGMEEGIVDRIFDPFFTTKEVGQGTGLGLSVSYGIVQQHDGAIRVKSRPGQGATFHVYLPVIADVAGHGKKPAVSRPEKGENEHILLVDDMADIIELVEPLLRRLGYRVTARTGSQEALEYFRNDPDQFDLVITDMSMPDMTGAQLAGEIRKIRPGQPIILCTGFSEQVDEEKARALGIDAFLMKPVVRDQLAAVVRRVLDERAGK